MNIYETLSRTALLVQRTIFPDLTEREIADGLVRCRVRLVADRRTALSAAGQTALTASLVSIVQSGARVELDVPDVALEVGQPPLEGDSLPTALRDHADELGSAVVYDGAPVDVAFVFGDASPGRARSAFHVSADGWSCRVDATGGVGVSGSAPFGGMLAGVAVGAESFRTVLRLLAERTGTRVLGQYDLASPHVVTAALRQLPSDPVDLGRLDVVSAGAITNAALFALLRVPGLRGALRIIDADIAAESNLNRYMLLRRRDLARAKAMQLADYSSSALRIEPEPARFEEATLPELRPLAEQVLVGVDDIPSRWLIQGQGPYWLGLAATTDFEVLVSEHGPKTPCAACLHPYDVPAAGEIPTVAFVSAAAGTLLAHRLLAHHHGVPLAAPTLGYPFNLASPRAISAVGLTARSDCRVGCAASRALQSADRASARS
jgi:molybdopterin/thiamine biosynthesis adenylyltransferase